MTAVRATAPGKIILFGEHSVNRGQSAIAVSVGMFAACRVAVRPEGPYRLRSGEREAVASRAEVLALAREMAAARAAGDLGAIRRLAQAYFVPTQCILGSALGEALPAGMEVEFTSEIPPYVGFGSSGAAFVALARCLGQLAAPQASPEPVGQWAYLGDVVAHGGVASALDTQTALHGTVIRFSVTEGARPLPFAPGLRVVVGNTRVIAPTSEVNGRVARWLEERPDRLHFFREIGLVSRLAEGALQQGDWPGLGQLLNLNQLLLRTIGVSCPEIDDLVDAALAAGAYGAKLSGSGGGGIVVALVDEVTAPAVAESMRRRGADVYEPVLARAGALTVE